MMPMNFELVRTGTGRRTSDTRGVGWVGNQSSSEVEEELGQLPRLGALKRAEFTNCQC